MWTDHCLQSGDATFPTTLTKIGHPGSVIQKGMNMYVDAYSGFMDNTQTLKTTLDERLIGLGIDELYIAGIATDVCVQWTVIDALGSNTANYKVTVVKDATAPVLGDMNAYNSAMAQMAQAGAQIVLTEDVLARECPTQTYECGAVRSAYRDAGCCGNPSSTMAMPR